MNKRFVIVIKFFVLGIYVLFFSGCELFYSNISHIELEEDLEPINGISSPDLDNRLWSILIYMAGDNDLEAFALEDVFEMEMSCLNTDQISVFFLLDRSDDYDTSNGNWTGSRLYKLKTGRSEKSHSIISEEIPCKSLSLYKDSNTELDMSQSYVLAESLSYVKENYPSEKLGLIMWGHGTGWRNSVNNSVNNNEFKGFAYDEKSRKFMSLKQFGLALKRGLNGYKLDFLGMDTCFGGELEVMYELKDYAKKAVGTEGLVLLSGWNYKNIFDDFEKSKIKDENKLCNIIVDNFSKDYVRSSRASIGCVDMARIEDYFNAFDETMKQAALNINERKIRDNVFSTLFNKSKNNTEIYSFGKEKSEVYVDIDSLINNIKDIFYDDEELKKKADAFMEIEKSCIVKAWASDRDKGGLGVYMGTLAPGNVISFEDSNSYIKGNVGEQIKFVLDSNGYVPDLNNSKSFLNRLFYEEFKN